MDQKVGQEQLPPEAHLDWAVEVNQHYRSHMMIGNEIVRVLAGKRKHLLVTKDSSQMDCGSAHRQNRVRVRDNRWDEGLMSLSSLKLQTDPGMNLR